MKSQRNAQGIALHLLSDPPPPLFFISTIIISCYATLPLMSFFQSSFVAIIFTAYLFVPIIYCYSTPSFLFVFVSDPVLCCPCLLPLHLAYLYMVFDFSCIVHSSIQPPTKYLFSQFCLCLCILTFLHLVVVLFVLFHHSPPPMPYSLYIDSDSACCIFHPL